MHLTKVRPRTEPYEFHKARQKVQQKDLKEYLKGRPVWRSMYLKPILDGFRIIGMERVKIQGTYVMPLCILCNIKEKYCKCAEEIS